MVEDKLCFDDGTEIGTDDEYKVYKISHLLSCIDWLCNMPEYKACDNNIKVSVSDIHSDLLDLVEAMHLYKLLGEKKTYYRLPVDGFGQPTGDVQEVKLRPYEAILEQDYGYIFDDYAEAVARAMD